MRQQGRDENATKGDRSAGRSLQGEPGVINSRKGVRCASSLYDPSFASVERRKPCEAEFTCQPDVMRPIRSRNSLMAVPLSTTRDVDLKP